MQKTISAEELLKIVQVVLKDELAAVIRKRGGRADHHLPGRGAVCPHSVEGDKKSLTARGERDRIYAIEYSLGRSASLHRQ